MKRYLFDAGSVNDYVHKRHGIVEKAKQREALGDKIGVAVPVLGELWAGIDLSTTPEKTRDDLLHALKSFKVWPYTEEAAKVYGKHLAMLKKKKTPYQPIALQIAAIAVSMGNCVVISKETAYRDLPEVAVENWAESK